MLFAHIAGDHEAYKSIDLTVHMTASWVVVIATAIITITASAVYFSYKKYQTIKEKERDHQE